MPTNRTKRTRQSQAIPQWQIDYCKFGYVPRPDGTRSPRPFLFGCRGIGEARDAWPEIRDQVLAEWISARPATRPHMWWIVDSPEPRQEGETEAAFLQRHGLLAPAEERWLKQHPEALAPETITEVG